MGGNSVEKQFDQALTHLKTHIFGIILPAKCQAK